MKGWRGSTASLYLNEREEKTKRKEEYESRQSERMFKYLRNGNEMSCVVIKIH